MTAQTPKHFARDYFRHLSFPAADDGPTIVAEDDDDDDKPTAAASSSGVPPRTPIVGDPTDVDAAERDAASGYYHHHFEEVSLIGRGSFGSVHVCRHVVGGEVVGIFAVKKVPVGDDAAYLRKVLSEVKILERVCHHPNVVQYHHSWLDWARTSDFGPTVRCLFILMEYAPHGSLESLIAKHGEVLSDDAVWYFFLSVLRGLRHLHDRGILHRDLKADNVLLSSNFADTAAGGGADGDAIIRAAPRPVLADFGTSGLEPHASLSAAEIDELLRHRTGGTGTEEYMAPELLERIVEHSSAASPITAAAASEGGGKFPAVPPRHERYAHFHTAQTDLFAMGVLLHRLAFGGAFPMAVVDATSSSSSAASAANRFSTSLPSAAKGGFRRPPEMVTLIQHLLQHDPARRPPSCAAILDLTEVREKWKAVANLTMSQLSSSPGQSRGGAASASAVAPSSRLPHIAAALPPIAAPPVHASGGGRTAKARAETHSHSALSAPKRDHARQSVTSSSAAVQSDRQQPPAEAGQQLQLAPIGQGSQLRPPVDETLWPFLVVTAFALGVSLGFYGGRA